VKSISKNKSVGCQNTSYARGFAKAQGLLGVLNLKLVYPAVFYKNEATGAYAVEVPCATGGSE
jgi:hypothetical protein